MLVAARVRLYRDGLAAVLGHTSGIDVVGAAGNRLEIVECVRKLEPDVVLLDASIPDSITAIRELRIQAREVKVVALACAETEQDAIRYAEAGVSGYVTCDDSLNELSATISAVARGDLVCSPTLAGALLRRVAVLAAERPPDNGVRLTRRELEVAQLIDDGLSNKQIALQLCIELATAKNHVHHILEKLQVTRRGEATARLRHRGVLSEAGSL